MALQVFSVFFVLSVIQFSRAARREYAAAQNVILTNTPHFRANGKAIEEAMNIRAMQNNLTRRAFGTVLLGLALTVGAGLSPLRAAPETGYGKPELLVDNAWLAQHRADANVRVLDLRDEKAYAAGHIPGAVHLNEAALRNPADKETYLPTPEAFAAMMSRAGVTSDTHVVLYDDQNSRPSARLWYVLNAYGHNRVSILNGGWKKYAMENSAASTETPKVAETKFTPRGTPELSCPAPQLLARKLGVVVLDVRSPEEYAGTQTSGGSAKAGRVPGAVNVDWRENVAGPYGEFKPAAELQKMYAAKGVTPEKEIVTYCASGGRAAHSLFTLKLLGYPHVKVYYGSFSDYTSRPDAPVEK